MAALLAGRVAVVTGGASGIGRAIALTFAEHGADVVIADVREEPRRDAEPTHRVIEAETDARGGFVECDVTDRDDVVAAVEAAETWGGVDVMVNNAGINLGGDLFDITEEDVDRTMAVNLKGTFFGAQVAAERLVERGEGSIINVSSTGGLEGSAGAPIYSASKGAVRLLTYALADALGPEGVRVNAIHPGTIETAMTVEDRGIVGSDRTAEFVDRVPLGRVGRPADVANAALYLASDLAAYVSGTSLVVDGGRTNTP